MSKGRVCLAYSGGMIRLAFFISGLDHCFHTPIAIFDKEFVDQIVFRAIQCNAIYEDRYLLGTALARPVIARAQVRAAEKYDQVRFELAFKACNPSIKVIAPWRLPEFCAKFQGRQDLLKFAAENNIPVSSTPKAPWSQDENLVHCSYEAGILEDPDHTPPKDLWTQTVDPLEAPDKPLDFTVHFEKGLPVKVTTPDQEATESVELFKLLNKIGHAWRRPNRHVSLKEQYLVMNMKLTPEQCREPIHWPKVPRMLDTPGLTIARLAHLDLEGLVLDSKIRKLRDQFVTIEWFQCIYNGMYFSPEREWLEESIISAQKTVNGQVRLRVYKGNVYVLGRSSSTSELYSQEDASMDSLDTFGHHRLPCHPVHPIGEVWSSEDQGRRAS
ncbi:hypothetical protein ACJ41O_013374 [Fusarium nematophilum]